MPPRSATLLDLEHLACLRGIRCGWLVKATGESAPGKKPKPSVNMCEHVGIMWNHVAWLNHHNRVLVGCFFHKKLRCFSFCVFFFSGICWPFLIPDCFLHQATGSGGDSWLPFTRASGTSRMWPMKFSSEMNYLWREWLLETRKPWR